MSDFYGAVAGVCLALLGLWWVVIELNSDQWLRDATLLRMAGRVSLYFLLPGTVSLLSMLDVQAPCTGVAAIRQARTARHSATPLLLSEGGHG